MGSRRGGEVELIDAAGRLLRRRQLRPGEEVQVTELLPAGLYLLRAAGETVRVVVE